MSKADVIRTLHNERCSLDEIAAVVGWKRKTIQTFLRTKLIANKTQREFIGWRGNPLSHRIVSF
ncbi:MAG: hypothetical protein ACN6O2_01360 [Stenotrophomonas sp.]